ncbi:MAG: alpha-amylase family glycosyl hydrolase [Candidatus Didemnitutus sp.]|nr:alpha-amylase family glycosyl hydrolase [Candidatus Didemnitutus sp.]
MFSLTPFRSWRGLFGCVLPLAVFAQPVVVPRFTHPGAGQTFYFVLTDRFANGNPANDTGGFAGGTEDHGFDPTRIGYFHGGDFAGLTANLDYIKDLGVTALWVTPPFANKPVQNGSAAYHGYWILDFLRIDPHLGTDAEFRDFIAQAHARGLKVYIDIITNHTADVIQYAEQDYAYVDEVTAPTRRADGTPFTARSVAFNGLTPPADTFPALAAERSFPRTPVVPPAELTAKNPAWLNNPIYYHNRGNSTFEGESSLHGDFSGLDDTFTEHPDVVRGFIEIYRHWIQAYGIDGFRIDTVRHVNLEFWQAFSPALRAAARAIGRPDFVQFGEVANDSGDISLLSEFSTTAPADATLDFGFFRAAQAYVAQGNSSARLAAAFDQDDRYTDHDSNVHTTTTFLGNHDAGRFAYFLKLDNPDAPPALLSELVRFGHGLLFLVRGQPVLYYGDEQGMIGRGGWDQQARESFFPSQVPDFRDASLLGTTRTGADDKFDPHHPFYLNFRALADLRAASPALRHGAMLVRPSGHPHVFAFSRIAREERVEHLAAFNNSRTDTVTVTLPTSQSAGATLALLHDSRSAAASLLTAETGGRVTVTLAPLQFALWRADAPLPVPDRAPTIAFGSPAAGAALGFPTRIVDGHRLAIRQEIRAEVADTDGVAEVTFTLIRDSRPAQYELLGVDDAAPFRIFWQPPPDLAPGERFSLVATVNDLRGHVTATRLDGLTVAAGTPVFGTRGATVPHLTLVPAAAQTALPGETVTLSVAAEGTGELEYQWLHNDEEIPGATQPQLTFTADADSAGRYRALVRNHVGTVLSPEALVHVGIAAPGARLEKHPAFPSQFVAARQVDVWLPPGYDADHAERYPVVYMHDGQNLFEPATSYTGVPWGIDGAMDRLLARGEAPAAIVVGIWNTPARFVEYMPQKGTSVAAIEKLLARFNLPNAPLQSDAYLRFIVEELKPFVDRSYRTRPEREHTFIMGSSMGGLISAYALVEYPAVFGGAGCVSTHWPADEGAMIDTLARLLPPPGAHKFYFDYGTEALDATYEQFQRRMDAVMRAAGYTAGRNWLTRKFPGATHSESSWRERVDIPLSFLLKS